MRKTILTSNLGLLALSTHTQAVVLDVDAQFGAPTTVIPLSGNSFTATDVGGSGVDLLFTQTGDANRTGFPRTLNNGGATFIQGSSVERTPSTSLIATDLATTVYAERGYTLEFFATGTTNPATVENLIFTIGDIDEDEVVGGLFATLGLSAVDGLSFSTLPSHVTQSTDSSTGVFLRSDGTSITNGTSGGDVTLTYANALDTVGFSIEKAQEENLGTLVGAFSFDVVAIPEPSSALLIASALGAGIFGRRRNG